MREWLNKGIMKGKGGVMIDNNVIKGGKFVKLVRIICGYNCVDLVGLIGFLVKIFYNWEFGRVCFSYDDVDLIIKILYFIVFELEDLLYVV